MKTNSETIGLHDAIRFLEHKQSQDLIALKEQLHTTYESVQPMALMKSTLHEVTTSPMIKNIILNNAIGFAAGYISKKILVGTSASPIKKIVGTLVQFSVAAVVTQNADGIRATGEYLLRRIFKSAAEHKDSYDEHHVLVGDKIAIP
jgi:hypothetical protein